MIPSLEVFHELGPRQGDVLCALHFLAGEAGAVTVSHPALTKALGWGRSSRIRRSIIDLERLGLVIVTNNSTPGAYRANTFTVLPLGREVAENIEAMGAA